MAKAKKDKVKIPKKIAGVKIPKEIRKAANGAIETLAEYPAISNLVASGLLAAAAAITGGRAPKKEAEPPSENADVAAGDEAVGDEATGDEAPTPPGKTAKRKDKGGRSLARP